MGLDMFLRKKNHVRNYNFTSKDNQYEVIVKKGGIKKDSIKSTRIVSVVEEVLYWRKANHIHNWFVQNIQEGEDDCKQYFVEEEKLKELLEVCYKVQNDNSLATKLLPCVDGFFFGSTEYNQDYFLEIKDTIRELEQILEEDNSDSSFYYSSSW